MLLNDGSIHSNYWFNIKDEKTHNLLINKQSKYAINLLKTKVFSDFSDSDTSLLYKFYSSLKYFNNISNISNEFYRKISQILIIRNFEENEFIFEIREKPKFVFIILKGSASVLMPSINNLSELEVESLNLQEVFRLNRGEAFGEFSLLYKQDRHILFNRLGRHLSSV